ncbi:MAG TPA: PhzF family phenazine biosynthesis protein [Clostridiales bacterium UBA9856]|nr:PhzF family phenazine biosynthesis protein [Clostridiales bacterium UBA9856]
MWCYIVDAFAEQIFGGNPAGVVILPAGGEYPSDEVMRKTAAELRYSETAFILPKGENRFQLRYFTPTEEVDLCGHATIGSFCALQQEGLVSVSKSYLAETLAGELEISVEGGFVMMDMATPKSLGVIQEEEALKELYGVMGIPESAGKVSLEGEWDLYPEIISTGLPDIILPVRDVKDLARIKPDFPALTKLSNDYNVVGVHAFALGEGLIGDNCCEGACEADQVTAYCRNFGPAVGIDEEAATGTANGALTYYLYKNALIDEGSGCRFLQGEAMGRPSVILSTIDEGESDVKIRVGGSGSILAKGEIFI